MCYNIFNDYFMVSEYLSDAFDIIKSRNKEITLPFIIGLKGSCYYTSINSNPINLLDKSIILIVTFFTMSSRLKQSKLSSIATGANRKNLDKSLEEQVYEMEIHNIEAERLRKTFLRMCGAPVMIDAQKYSN